MQADAAAAEAATSGAAAPDPSSPDKAKAGLVRSPSFNQSGVDEEMEAEVGKGRVWDWGGGGSGRKGGRGHVAVSHIVLPLHAPQRLRARNVAGVGGGAWLRCGHAPG